MKSHLLILIFLIGSTFTVYAQNKFAPTDQLIVKLKPNVAAESFLNEFIKEQKLTTAFYAGTPSTKRRLSVLEFDPYFTNTQKIIDLLNKKSEVHYAAFNERATVRATPNDPEYFEQWHMNLINAPEVWDFTTGGLTPLGDTIVIATMEACDTQHEDIQENIWRNYLEIPNNGIEAEGAFVVATNSSFGDYMVVVTNTNRQDVLQGSFSGTATHMDLSAPGTGSFTTRFNNEYSSFSGSSASTPHVTGGIGLLYSANCAGFTSFAKNDPSQAALTMKSFILNGTTKVTDLEGKTVSGGRLNLEGSLNLLQEFCGGGAGPLTINSISPNPLLPGNNLATVRFQTPDEATYQIKVTDVLGRTVYTSEVESTTFGTNLVEIETFNFTTGIYYFTVENSRDTETKPFVVF